MELREVRLQRVGEMGHGVRERDLHGLEQRVLLLARVARGEPRVDAERLQRHHALHRRRQLVDVDVAEARVERLDPGGAAERREVVGAQRPAGVTHRGRERRGDRAGVERRGALLGDPAQHAAQRRVREPLAGRRRAPARQEPGGGTWRQPPRVLRPRAGDHRRHGEPPLGEVDRRTEHARRVEPAVGLEQPLPQRHRAGHGHRPRPGLRHDVPARPRAARRPTARRGRDPLLRARSAPRRPRPTRARTRRRRCWSRRARRRTAPRPRRRPRRRPSRRRAAPRPPPRRRAAGSSPRCPCPPGRCRPARPGPSPRRSS